MIHIFSLAWNPETGEANVAGTIPLEVAQQLIVKLMAQMAVKQALDETKKAEEKAKQETKGEGS